MEALLVRKSEMTPGECLLESLMRNLVNCSIAIGVMSGRDDGPPGLDDGPPGREKGRRRQP